MRKWIPRLKLRHLILFTTLAAIATAFFTQVTSIWYDNVPGCRQLIINFNCPTAGLDSISFSTTEPYFVRWLFIEKDNEQPTPADGRKTFDDYKGSERSLSFQRGYVCERVILSRFPAEGYVDIGPPGIGPAPLDPGPPPPANPFKRVASPSAAE